MEDSTIYDLLKNIVVIIGAILSVITIYKVVYSLKNPFKKLIFFILDTCLKRYIELIVQQKLIERLAHVSLQLTKEDKDYLKLTRNNMYSPTYTIKLEDQTHIRLKNFGLVNESFDYINSNLNLQNALQGFNKLQVVNMLDILLVRVTLTQDGWIILNLIELVEKNSKDDNYKNFNMYKKAYEEIIKKFSN